MGAKHVMLGLAFAMSLALFANATLAAGVEVQSAARGVLLNLEVSKPTYRLGEPIVIRLTIRNTGPLPAAVYFDGHQYELFIAAPGNRVWTLTRATSTARSPQTITVGPGQMLVFVETWNQRTAQGSQVGPGSYRLGAVFKGRILIEGSTGAQPSRAAAEPIHGASASARPHGAAAQRPPSIAATPGWITMPAIEFVVVR